MKINKIHNEVNITYLKNNYGKTILPLSVVQNEYMPSSSLLEILFFWNKESTSSESKESISKAIEHYNLFSSRLIMIDDNKFALQYCTDGFKFNFLPSIDATFDNVDIDDIKKMMIHVKTLPGEPLFAVTVIPIKGGRFVGVSCSDLVADAFSLILFLYAWKCIIEGHDKIPLPSPQRLFKGKPIRSDKINKALIPPLSKLSRKMKNLVKLSDMKTYTKKEYFSDEFLDEIKDKAKSKNENNIISNSQIITSFLLKKYHNHIMPDTDRIVLRNPVNLRDIHPDINALYIGNAFFDNITEFTKDEIDKMSIYEIAHRLKESIASTRNENYIKEISYLSKYGIEFKDDIFKKHRPYNINTDIVSSNLIHLNDPESLGLSSNLVNILYINAGKTSFIMLKEKSGEMFAQITSRYPLI